jgi:hypothetical protein
MMVDKSDIKDHFDKYVLYMYCFAGKKQFIFIWGLGQDMNSYKQQQGSKITKENILHVVYFRSEFLQIRMGQHF